MPPPDELKAVDPRDVFDRRTLGEGMSLGRLGRALSEKSGDLMDEISSRVRRVVDLPADVYRTVVHVPDERRVRERLAEGGPNLLAIVVPVTRTIVSATDIIPGGPHLQPVLLGKVFGIHDYIDDRRSALEALPALPAELRKEITDAARFVREHQSLVQAATRALPSRATLETLASTDFWRDTASEEWETHKARVDGHYEGVAKTDARHERDLPLFRAAYALAYFTLGHVDPVAATLSQLMPTGVAAYQRFATHRERFARIVGRLRDANIDLSPSGDSRVVAEVPPQTTPRRDMRAPEAAALPPAPAPRRAVESARPPKTPTLSAVEAVDMPPGPDLAAWAPRRALDLPSRPLDPPTPPPQPSGRAELRLHDPGLPPASGLEPPPGLPLSAARLAMAPKATDLQLPAASAPAALRTLDGPEPGVLGKPLALPPSVILPEIAPLEERDSPLGDDRGPAAPRSPSL